MLKALRLAGVFLLAPLFFFSFTQSVLAQEEFTISKEILYQLDEQGRAQVRHQVQMTNNFSSIYATHYSLTITGNQLIKNISATSQNNNQELATEVDRANRDLTKITVFFDPPVTGKNKTNHFIVKYQVDDFVENLGQTKRVIIPKINDIGQIEETSLKISAPKSFGPPSFVSPRNFQKQTSETETIISFSQADLFEKEVMAIFGEIQSMQFNLKYFLENLDDEAKEMTIALPPDTSYQKVFLTNLDPKPQQVTIDEDGNWLAHYWLQAKEELTIEARGIVQITAEPQSPPIIPVDFSAYLKEDVYWEVNDPKIRNLAQDLKTVEQIYHYVVNNLEYNFDRVRNRQIARKGALEALRNPDQAICTEFTDLFIALARAAGIPARELNGYAYSTNPQMLPSTLYADVLHSWPEYWDNKAKTWRQVDPTWEATSNVDYFNKMDMTHFAFVIHGQSSQFPLPAGAYQRRDQHRKSVNISFTKDAPDLTFSDFEIDSTFPNELAAGRNLAGEIIITNPNNRAFYQIEVELVGEGVGVSPKRITIPALPPLGQAKLSATLSGQAFLGQNNSRLIVRARVKNFETQEIIPIKSLSLINWQTVTNHWQILLPVSGLFVVLVLVVKKLFNAKKTKNQSRQF